MSFDEHNKYIYYLVVDMPGLPTDTLHARAQYFLKTAYPKTILKSDNTKAITGDGKFIVDDAITGERSEKGEIAYRLNIEFKDQKYRFWLTDFVFTPQLRDKNGDLVSQPGGDIPLEEITGKLDAKEAGAYLDGAGKFCRKWGDKLKLYMIRTGEPKKGLAARKVVTDDW